MLQKIKNKIKILRKKKYQKVLFSQKDLVLRENGIEYITSLNVKKNHKKKISQSYKFYFKNLNNKNFINFYKKFNSNIDLKEKYNLKSFKKKSNKIACLKTYFLFSKFLIASDQINNLQKLNTILKINDIFILRFNKTKHIDLIEYFKKNIQYERKLIKTYS